MGELWINSSKGESDSDAEELEEWEEEMLPISFVSRSNKDQYFEIWEENIPAMDVFFSCCTQWRHSMSGVTGLDYTALKTVLELKRIKPKKHPKLFEDVRIIELGALSASAEKK